MILCRRALFAARSRIRAAHARKKTPKTARKTDSNGLFCSERIPNGPTNQRWISSARPSMKRTVCVARENAPRARAGTGGGTGRGGDEVRESSHWPTGQSRHDGPREDDRSDHRSSSASYVSVSVHDCRLSLSLPFPPFPLPSYNNSKSIGFRPLSFPSFLWTCACPL